MRKERKRSIITSIGMTTLIVLVLICIFGCAAGFLGIGNTASWKEEALLHDGSKIIVERWQKHGGSHEPGQKPGISDQSITFTMPGTNKTIKWEDEASDELGGHANFNLVALHFMNSTPYIITTPDLCLSYNKWGRPNPPYVIFKYENKKWKRIELSEMPAAFKDINLVINVLKHEEKLVSQGIASEEMVKKLNSSLTQEEYKTILRTPIKIWCEEMILDGTYWHGISGLRKQPSYEACVDLCPKIGISAANCPCTKLFKINSKGEK